MRSLVIYSSKSGNTKQLADAIFEDLSGEKSIYPIKEAPEPDLYDFIAIGFWVKGGKPDSDTLDYLPKINGQKVFLFATHGAAIGSEHVNAAMAYARATVKNGHFVGEFNCQGEVSQTVLEKLIAKPQPPAWIADAETAAGHPNDNDIMLLKKIILKINKLLS